jgi:hypothetical protein
LYFPAPWVAYDKSGVKQLGQEERLREFIVEFVTDELKPYRGKSADQIQQVVPEFRYLPRQCRQAVLEKIRQCPACGQRKTKQCLLCEYVLTHAEINTGVKVCPQCQASLKDHGHPVCKHGCATPSVRTSLNTNYSEDPDGANLGDYVVQKLPTDTERWLLEAKADFDRIHQDLYDFLVLVYRHFSEGGHKRDITRKLAIAKKLSLKAARRLRTEIQSTVTNNPVVMSLYKVLDEDRAIRTYLAVPMSRKAKDSIASKREASALLRENYKDLGIRPPKSEVQSSYEAEGNCFLDDGSRGSATYRAENANNSFREMAAQDILDSLIDASSETEVREYFNLKKKAPLPGIDMSDRDDYCGLEMSYDEETGYDVSVE